MSWIIDVNTLCRSVLSMVKYAFSPAAGFPPPLGFVSARTRFFSFHMRVKVGSCIKLNNWNPLPAPGFVALLFPNFPLPLLLYPNKT